MAWLRKRAFYHLASHDSPMLHALAALAAQVGKQRAVELGLNQVRNTSPCVISLIFTMIS
jgi:hypothetical protein